MDGWSFCIFVTFSQPDLSLFFHDDGAIDHLEFGHTQHSQPLTYLKAAKVTFVRTHIDDDDDIAPAAAGQFGTLRGSTDSFDRN